MLSKSFTCCCVCLGLPKFTELNVSVAAQTAVGLGPASQPVKVKTREGGKFTAC